MWRLGGPRPGGSWVRGDSCMPVTVGFLITRNKHKLDEANAILEEYDLRLEQADIEKLEIQHNDLHVIAWRAALNAYRILGKPVVVDDSGLFIKALSGFPGPYSSYVYRTLGLNGVLKLLENSTDRSACFKSVVAAVIPPLSGVFAGSVCGWIAEQPRGEGGFGFDPIFIPEGSDRTFAEMSLREKNLLSHRARAFRAFAKWYIEWFSRVKFKGTQDKGL